MRQRRTDKSPTPPPAAAALTIEMWPIDRLKPYAKNARRWSQAAVEKIAASIREFGFRQPIVADLKDEIVIGHLRWHGAKHEGLTEVPVHVAKDLSPAQIKALCRRSGNQPVIWPTLASSLAYKNASAM